MWDFTRSKNVINNNKTGETKVFESINDAKRESRKLQRHGHTVTVIRHVTYPQKMHAIKRRNS